MIGWRFKQGLWQHAGFFAFGVDANWFVEQTGWV